MPHLSAILSLKIASRKIFFKVGGFDFVFSPETRIAPSENALPYDQTASGAIIYAYVSGNPVNFIDPLGLTQRDIDVARLLAIQSQPDLAFPDTYGSSDRIGANGARTIYGLGTVLNPAYMKDLRDDQALDLLDTIIHEGIHLKYPPEDPRNKEDDDKHTGYPYEEAARRLKNNPKLVKEFLKRRKAPLVCP